MNKVRYCTKNQQGFGLVEVIVASAILALFITSIFGTLVFTNRVLQVSTSHAQALFLAEEGREAVRNIRDEDFTNLVDGTYGLAIVGGMWSLVGSSDTTDGFIRTVTITPVSSDSKSVTTQVSWTQYGKTRYVESNTLLSYWQRVVPVGPAEDCLEVIPTNAVLNGNGRILSDIVMQNICSTSDVTITMVTVSWSGAETINRYRFQPATVWSQTGFGTPSGAQGSGTQLDIVDYILTSADGLIENVITFDNSMNGQTFSIAYTLSDGSVVEVVDIIP